MPIKKKLLVVFITIGVLPILFVGNLSFTNATNVLRGDALSRLEVVADHEAKEIEGFFDDVKSDLQMAQDFYNVRTHLPVLSLHDRTHPESVRAMAALNSQLGTFTEVKGNTNVSLTNPQGRIVYRSARQPSDLQLDGFLQEVDPVLIREAGKGIYLSPVFLDEAAGNKLYLLAAAQVRDFAGTFIGLVVFHIQMGPLYGLIRDLADYGDTSETSIGRLEGEEAIFLSPLRHDKDSALMRNAQCPDW